MAPGWPEGSIDGTLAPMVAIQRPGAPSTVVDLDETDRRLLIELQADARLTLAELGRRVGLSPPAVGERVRRLTDEGVIRGFRTDVDPRALGYALSAIVRIRPAPRQLAKVADLARATPEVVECHRITGEDCFFLKAHVRDVEHLEDVIDRFTVFGQTTTSVMQTSPVPLRGVAITVV
ncbi:MAG: Lrp/AsnC family transcriptional regulator [Conexibacter sp.]|nr:Lrp/AsnC family transcriptional regulator [Conexibacter sp.]